MSDPVFVPVDKLTLGMYVSLDLSWLQHPFPFGSFLLQTQDEIETIRGLGLEKVQVDFARSSLPVAPSEAQPDNHEKSVSAAAAPLSVRLHADERSVPYDRNRAIRDSIVEAEKKAAEAVSQVRLATKQFATHQAEAVSVAGEVVTSMAETLLGNSDLMVHLMSEKVAGEEIYFHSLNVAMLALLLGKALNLNAQQLNIIGIAALFHDIGKEKIPPKLLQKTERLTLDEIVLLKKHPEFGADLALQAKMDPLIAAAIAQHHENMDGSGYPVGLTAEKINVPAKIIAIANQYDNLCNPINPANALTPYDALATMFAKRKGWFDGNMLSRFVHVLGVYPPGSLVKLSNGMTGLVTSVNTNKPLRPSVMIHDVTVPRATPTVLDLEFVPDISISKALRPSTVAPSVLEYLSFRKRNSYFFGDLGKVA